MTRTLRARWLLPIDGPPIENGWIEIADDRIVAIGDGRPAGTAEDLGDVVVMPGLVNAHTHLELSWMAGLVPPAESFVAWVRTLMTERRRPRQELESLSFEAMMRAAEGARATGTVLIGDISNSLTSPDVLRAAGLGGVVFHELLGFSEPDPEDRVRSAWVKADDAARRLQLTSSGADDVVISVCAHAPYSVSPALFTEIAKARRDAPLTVHAGESVEEMEFLRTGAGPFLDFIRALGGDVSGWEPPDCDPVEYLNRLGYLQPDGLVVHGVQLSNAALGELRAADAVLVTCPRSNTWVGAGTPSVTRFYAEGLRVAIGTDSLASVASLNMFDELAELRRLAPEVTAAQLLESATKTGATALGFGRDFGTLTAGKRAALVSVDLAGRARDVEEYLVSGVPPDRVRRVS